MPNEFDLNPGPVDDIYGPAEEFMGPPEAPGGTDFDPSGGGGGVFKFDLEALIALFLGLASGAQQASAINASREATEEQIERARGAASPENFANVFKTIQPIFRELVAAGAGPQLSGAILSGLGKSGGKDTGRGQALAAAGAGAGETLALNMTAGEAGRIQSGQVGAELGALSNIPGPRVDPFIQALVQGAAGYFGASTRERQEPGGGAGTSQNIDPNRNLFPNIRA